MSNHSQRQQFQPSLTKKQTASHLFAFFTNATTCFFNWTPYLHNDDFPGEPELKNKINAIWICSLLDILDGEQRLLTKLKAHSEFYESPIFLECCDGISFLRESAEEILSLYTKNEQLFLNDFRDQIVHSWLHKSHQKNFMIVWFDGTTLVRERIEFFDYHSIVRPFYEGGLDKCLAQCIRVKKDRKLKFWQFIGSFLDGNLMERLQKEIYLGIEDDSLFSYFIYYYKLIFV